MPPKGSRAAAAGNHEDSKSETPTHKEKNGHSTGSHQSGTKLRRVASSAGSTLKDVTTAAALLSASQAQPPPAPEPFNPSLQWSTFDRDFLHKYRRAYSLTTPTSYSSDYHSWVLNQPGSVGLHSPTVKRRKEWKRQSKGSLTNTVRKHFNSLGVQENDAIVDFLHKVRTEGSYSSPRVKKQDLPVHEVDR